MNIKFEEEFIKKLERRLGGLSFKVAFKSGISMSVHERLSHYMMSELVHEYAYITVYTVLSHKELLPCILPLEDTYDIRCYLEVVNLKD